MKRTIEFALLLLSPCIGVAQWTDGQEATAVLGQQSFTSMFTSVAPSGISLYGPQGIAVDPVSGRYYIADATNNRVLWWISATALQNGSAADGVLGQPDFTSRTARTTRNGLSLPMDIVIDRWGTLWVADRVNRRVLRFDNVSAKLNGADADGVLGQPDFVSDSAAITQAGMGSPSALAVDTVGTLWVVDEINRRVLRFDSAFAKSNGADADGVLGQSDFTSRFLAITQSGMLTPMEVCLDRRGTLWVVDRGAHRITRYDNAAQKPNGGNADGVMGQASFTAFSSGTTSSALKGPFAAVFDTVMNIMYVADRGNNRILRFDSLAAYSNGFGANGVLGQPNFTSGDLQVVSGSTLSSPTYVTADDEGRLWVSDNVNRRVLRYDAAASKPNGDPSDGVLGQSDFVSVAPIISGSTLFNPSGVAFDPVSRKLYVSDRNNHRVLRWSEADAIVSGSAAEAVFGQSDVFSNLANRGGAVPAANSLNQPTGIAVDTEGRLWVLDAGNARILRFDAAASLSSGANANGVLGQVDFVTPANPVNDSTATQGNVTRGAIGLAVDPGGSLYVADGNSIWMSRVLRWDNAAMKSNGANADGVLGQPDFISREPLRGSSTPAANSMMAPFGVATDYEGRLYVADGFRVLRFDDAASKANGVDADAVLGQPDFISNFGTLGSGGTTLTQDRMDTPIGVSVDGDGNLYVGDVYNRRTLFFRDAKTKPNGAPADNVLGQPDFTTATIDVSSSITAAGSQIAVDDATGRIWLALGYLSLNNQNRIIMYTASGPLSVTQSPIAAPVKFALSQNYPNPFNGIASFLISVASHGVVQVRIFDILGRELTTLLNEEMAPGSYTLQWNSGSAPSGVYLIRMQSEDFVATRKIVLVK